MRGRRRATEAFNLSFLDVICCGFGGIILLLVLTKVGEPRALEQATRDLDGLIARLQEELHEIRGESDLLERELKTREEQLSEETENVARLQGDLSKIRGEFASSRELSEVSDIIEGRLLAAQQQLTEEMKRLQRQEGRSDVRDELVGGIPVDSEYVVFVIDTSGSMVNYAWSSVVQKMTQVLDIYPKVKGIQVMNDMGQYMFPGYAGKWIPDTPLRRSAILDRLRTWSAFSNSSPVEGIERAIRAYAAPDKKISIYVFGDEFTGSSVDDVVRTVDGLNRADASGERRVRIHAVGFPVTFLEPGAREFTGIRFAMLMRALCERNGGTFVGLNRASP
ncbi:MAG: VWA domain-containing protein [Acidobacteriota bacterium]